MNKGVLTLGVWCALLLSVGTVDVTILYKRAPRGRHNLGR